MKIGYLHVGINQTGESGVTRFGRKLAAAATTLPDVEIKEANVTFTKGPQNNLRLLREAIKQLEDTDILHLNYAKFNWGGGWQLYYLGIVLSQYHHPIIVTLHDVYAYLYPKESFVKFVGQKFQYFLNKNINIFGFFKNVSGYWVDNWAIKLLAKSSKIIVVNNQEELRRIDHLIPTEKLRKINIYVEERNITLTPREARQILGLQDYKLITLQGFIFASKGHKLLIEALPHLDKNVKVIFAGTFAKGNEPLYQSLLKEAESLGVADRLIVTGYLSETELEHYLLATHLAVCPFTMMSASASLSTWISVARPILASNLPQIQEYNLIESGAIHTFESGNVADLVDGIQKILPSCGDYPDTGVSKLREKLLISEIIKQYQSLYQEIQQGNK